MHFKNLIYTRHSIQKKDADFFAATTFANWGLTSAGLLGFAASSLPGGSGFFTTSTFLTTLSVLVNGVFFFWEKSDVRTACWINFSSQPDHL